MSNVVSILPHYVIHKNVEYVKLSLKIRYIHRINKSSSSTMNTINTIGMYTLVII